MFGVRMSGTPLHGKARALRGTVHIGSRSAESFGRIGPAENDPASAFSVSGVWCIPENVEDVPKASPIDVCIVTCNEVHINISPFGVQYLHMVMTCTDIS